MHSRSWSRGAVLLALVSVTVTSTANALFEPRYERCEALLDRREVMDVCGHSINPSAVAYLPSARRLVIAGQEYLIHATESGSGRLAVDGCYFGADRSLGRGDIEGIASLDFALSKPEPNMDPSGRLTANWAKVRSTDASLQHSPLLSTAGVLRLYIPLPLPAVSNAPLLRKQSQCHRVSNTGTLLVLYGTILLTGSLAEPVACPVCQSLRCNATPVPEAKTIIAFIGHVQLLSCRTAGVPM